MDADALVAFLRARLDEDERIGRAAIGDHYSVSFGHSDWTVIEHIDRWTSARVLADVAAKRVILDLHSPYDWADSVGPRAGCNTCGDFPMTDWPCRTVLLLASVWADHPDFDPAWRVDVSPAADREQET